MGTNVSLPYASTLVTTPFSTLRKKTRENAKHISRLEYLLRKEKLKLNSLITTRDGDDHAPAQLPAVITPRTPLLDLSLLESSPCDLSPRRAQFTNCHQQLSESPDVSPRTLSLSEGTPDRKGIILPVAPKESPKGVICQFQSPILHTNTSSVISNIDSKNAERSIGPNAEPMAMAARGSHWSFAEKQRFETALHRFGPFAWEQIIEAVGTRSDKQVKAYAARYRRRKKLAAKTNTLPESCMAADASGAAASVGASQSSLHPPPNETFVRCTDASSPRVAVNSENTLNGVPLDSHKFDFNETKRAVFAYTEVQREERGTHLPSVLDDDLLNDRVVPRPEDDANVQLQEQAELDVLVDGAIDDQTGDNEDVTRPPLVQFAEDHYSSDFINALFGS